jgi:hypothetical protein
MHDPHKSNSLLFHRDGRVKTLGERGLGWADPPLTGADVNTDVNAGVNAGTESEKRRRTARENMAEYMREYRKRKREGGE